MGPRLLVVNADDFGLTSAVCRGILEAHQHGIVTSTSALVVAPAFASNCRSLAESGLGVGAHLAAVGEDPPLLSAREIPSLVDASGRLPPTWKHFVARSARGSIDRDDLRREWSAQIAAMESAGLRLTHLDSHQHLHLWPPASIVFLELARAHSIGAIRSTRSRRWSPTSLGVRTCSAAVRRRARQVGIAVPDASVGFDEAGSFTEDRMLIAIVHLATTSARTTELSAHPGDDPDPDRGRYRWGYRWSDELAALCSRRVRVAVDAAGFSLGTFGDLVGDRGSLDDL